MLRRLFKGILAGGIIGFIGGILFAPAKGEESRAKLKEMAEDPKVKSFIDKAKTTGTDLAKKAQDFVNEKCNCKKD